MTPNQAKIVSAVSTPCELVVAMIRNKLEANGWSIVNLVNMTWVKFTIMDPLFFGSLPMCFQFVSYHGYHKLTWSNRSRCNLSLIG
jgi:hypothetical protein